MKKNSYHTKTKEELTIELKALRASVQKLQQDKKSKDYSVARKNVARVLTAVNALSTKAKK